MSPLVRQLRGPSAQFVLPARLSSKAQRDVLIRSGRDIGAEQVFAIPNLMDLSVEERVRLVDVAEHVTVRCDLNDPDEIDGPWSESVREARVDRYGELQLGSRGRWIRSGDEGGVRVDEVFYASPDRTINAQLQFEGSLEGEDVDAFRAMLGGAPLVTEIPDGSTLELEHVLGAYERAIKLAAGFVRVLDQGIRDEDVDLIWFPISRTDDGVFFLPDPNGESDSLAAAILLAASPDAYATAEGLYEQLRTVPIKELTPVVEGFCERWWQSTWESESDRSKLRYLSWDLTRLARKQEKLKQYEVERASWINLKGSTHLKRAAARDYRHDGIYRDERLAVELPGFASTLGRKPTIRDLINPSAEALELEEEVLSQARLLGIRDDQVRLVWATPDSEMPMGEYLQIREYLGRHTVWRRVDPDRDDDDIS